MQGLDIVTEDARWTECDLAGLAAVACTATLDHLGLDAGVAELALLACDNDRIAVLNADFRDKPAPTNVLSWPATDYPELDDGAVPALPEPGLDGMIELGDVAISYDTCAAEAAQAGLTMQAHVTHLIVHGVLHLLGYDHIREGDATLMERIEVEILGKLGYDDPYCKTLAQ